MTDPSSSGSGPGRSPSDPDPTPIDPTAPQVPVAPDRSATEPDDPAASPTPVSLFGDPPTDPLADVPVTDYEGIGSASRSCLVILLLATAIVVLICVSTIIRAIT